MQAYQAYINRIGLERKDTKANCSFLARNNNFTINNFMQSAENNYKHLKNIKIIIKRDFLTYIFFLLGFKFQSLCPKIILF